MQICAKTVILLTCLSPLFSQPNGFKLIQGEAASPHLESCAQIISSGNAIIEWEDFSIGERERFEFKQGSVADTVLNRVTGSLRSEILGELHSNGKVILVNPQGVFIGPNGRVDTAGLIASSLDLSNEQFLSPNEFLFHGESMGEVVNLGTIEAGGEVFLLGPNVRNDGVIRGENVGLGVGRSILVRPEGSQRILIQIPIEEGELSHSGHIEGLKIELKSGAFAKAIQCSGVIDANRLEECGGEIYLVAEEGTCQVSGSLAASGGKVHILGDQLALFNGAEVDVSGRNGGGEILVGGDFQGANREIQNSSLTFVEKETFLRADALENGNGGKVVLWSDQATYHCGMISAQGGRLGGDGGLVEVSGADLHFRGLADMRAPNGKAGELLLDPINITISTAANSANVLFSSPNYQGTSGTPCSPTPALIQTTDIQNNLALGNVTISTNATNWAGCADAGNIIVSNSITWSAATTLTLAGQRLTVNAPISSTSATTGFTAMEFTASGTSGNNDGFVLDNQIVSSVGGDIHITATSGTGIQNYGVDVFHSSGSGGQINTTNGAIILTGTTANTVGPGTGVGIRTGSVVSASGNGTITLIGLATAGAKFSSGVEVSGSVQSNTGTISITGTASPDTGASHGVSFSGGVVSSTSSGNISVTGLVPATATGNNVHGISMGTASGITSSSGTMTLSGRSNSSGTGCFGVNISQTWTTGTTGDITFTNCSGGSGTNGHGINVGAAFSTAGNVIATNLIRGGTGSGSVGFVSGFNFATTGASKNITITASSQATAGSAHGISITAGTFATNSGAMTLTGTAGSSTSSHGINLGVALTSSQGISLTGTPGAGGSSFGVNLGGNLTASGNAISISGTTQLTTTISLDSTNGGLTAAGANISITGAVTGAQALTLRAGSAGGITFGSTVGTTLTRVTTLTLTSGASLSLGGSLFLTNSVAIPMATTLTGNAEINTGL